MRMKIRDVERAACMHFCLTPLRLRQRKKTVDRKRQITMFLAREMTASSFPQIGRYFQRDHTTVMHACDHIAKLVTEDAETAADVLGMRIILAMPREIQNLRVVPEALGCVT